MTGQQLKNSILQMAVQGKLVPQDPNDEPASVLLERIRAEKEKLIKEGKIKKEKTHSVIFRGADNLPYEKIGKNEPVCIADEVPFDVPESWEWVRLGTVCEIARGGSPRPIKQFLTDSPSGVNWIKISDSDKGGKYINATKEKIIPAGVAKSRYVHAGDFLLTNSMSFGRPYILNVDGCIHDGWLVLSDYQNAYDKDFLFYMLSSAFAYSQFCDIVSGAVVKNLNSDKVSSVLFPLPPITEQRRIVAKLDEVEQSIIHYTKSEGSLSNLTNSFPQKLKKSILQYAVQGKLVPQDPTDEPATILLKRIRAEKEKLIKSGKIKRDKHESVIFRRDNSYYERVDGIERCIDDEIPFEIPDNWEWVRIKHVGRITTGNTPSRIHPEYFGADIPFVSPGDIHDGKIDIPSQGLSFEGMKVGRIIPQGSILQVCIGGSIGKAAICDFDISFNQQINAIEPIICNSKYLFYAISAPYFISRVKDKAGGTATPIISKGQWENMLMPLSPLKEQQRIATRIDNLLHKLMVL